ncbi:MAG: hypothetical protein HW381_1982 [Candidatus Rokubacteria bacterium]|nr:hypothetical protein [Candidatus Rokubacteria bacterium]
MGVNLSIKKVPEHTVHRLKQRAERHHRSLQGELLAIIEEAARTPSPLSPEEVVAEVRRLGLRTPSAAAAMIRADRDGR